MVTSGECARRTPEEFERPVVGDSDANLLVFDDQNDVLVRWVGPACPSTTSLAISESGNEILVQVVPPDGCDAAGATYGVVLSYDTSREAANLSIDYPLTRPVRLEGLEVICSEGESGCPSGGPRGRPWQHGYAHRRLCVM